MRYADFEDSPAGRLVPTEYEARAFVPNPLPPEIDLGAIALDLADASSAIGELRGACRLPGLNHAILIGPLQRLEAQTSSAMEGTYTTTDELVLEEAGVSAKSSSETVEVGNYIRALTWALREMSDLPISARLLKGAHQRLLTNVGAGRGQDKLPGEFKRNQNMIGGRTLDTARFIPPPPKETEECISSLERYINRLGKDVRHSLLDLAIVHYQFETIHPFADGNGRVGRMLISLMAVADGLLEKPILYASPDLEKHKDEYIDRLYAVSAQGAWVEWIQFFLQSIARSCRASIDKIERLVALGSEFKARAAAASRSANILTVIDMLFERPAVNASQVVARLGVTDASARNILRQLVSLGIVEERGTYPTYWIAPDILQLSRPD